MSEEKEQKNTEIDELGELRKKADEYLDGWKRAKADYINREKSIAQEKSVLREIMEEAMILEFLPILDNLKQALNTTIGYQVANSEWVKGIEQVVKMAEDILKKFGVEKIDVLDKEFNAAFAEAAERQSEGNKVVKVVLDGYRKGERIIRPARVVVG